MLISYNDVRKNVRKKFCHESLAFLFQDSLIGARCTNPDDPFSLNAILSGVEQVFGGKGRSASKRSL